MLDTKQAATNCFAKSTLRRKQSTYRPKERIFTSWILQDEERTGKGHGIKQF